MPGNYTNEGVQAQTVTAGSEALPQQKKGNRGRILLIVVIAVLVLAVIGVGVLRYLGPERVAQSYVNDLFANKYADAFALLCPADQAAAKASFQYAASQPRPASAPAIDTSHLVYSIKSESLNSATVSVTGSIEAVGDPATAAAVGYTVKASSNGLGWCINALRLNLTS